MIVMLSKMQLKHYVCIKKQKKQCTIKMSLQEKKDNKRRYIKQRTFNGKLKELKQRRNTQQVVKKKEKNKEPEGWKTRNRKGVACMYLCMYKYVCVRVRSCSYEPCGAWAAWLSNSCPVGWLAVSVYGRGSQGELWSLQSVTEEFWQRGKPPTQHTHIYQ